LLKELTSKYQKYLQGTFFALISLILIKIVFQVIVVRSGLRWLTADDYCRTIISYEWLQHPKIYAGVWLALHFWINGLFIAIFKDLTVAPVLVNTIFSILTLIYLYLLLIKIFDRSVAYLSCLIFAVFPFQVWLSTSGMPESIFFFFIIAINTVINSKFFGWTTMNITPVV
jgi:4-amino-4-deoxy-L-arabinose transferase-like glycosyltransferase